MATSNTSNIPKCQIAFVDSCLPSGDLNVDISYGTGLFQIQIQSGGVNQSGGTQCCEANTSGCIGNSGIVLQPDPTSSTGWPDVTITGYCDLDYSMQNAEVWDGSGTAPSWADPNGCGTGVLQSDTAIYFFYDTTSLNDSEQSAIYQAANDWVIALRAGGTYTGKVYHLEAFGERWVLWPAWIVDHSINAGGTDQHSNGCNGANSCHDQAATPWVYPQGTNTSSGTHWTNDPNASLGPGQLGTTLPVAAEGPTANVLAVLFHDESEGVPCSNYQADPANTTANTGNWGPSGATTGSWPEFGNTNNTLLENGYHFRFSGGGFQVVPWEEATGSQASSDPGNVGLTDLWKYDVLRTKTIVANHQSSGTLKTFVYPADHTPNGSQVVFPLHLLGAIVTGTLTTAPTCAIADLTNITTSNPYSTEEGGRFGQLDQLDFGYNVACAPFAAGTFVADLEAFISGGTGVTCDQTDCVKVQVIDSLTSSAIAGHSVNIGGTSYTTDAQGYTTLVTGLANAAVAIECMTLPLLQGCMQHLVILKYLSVVHNPTSLCSFGCTDNTTVNGAGLGINGALNYDPTANIDDGSCIYCVYGCMNPLSLNYNPLATCDDGSCMVMPDTAECLLKDISKQLLEDCTDLCEDNPKTNKLRSDLQYAESLLAQFYQMYKCDTEGGNPVTTEAYTKIFSAFRKLFQEYQCDNCGQYHPGQTGISTGSSTGTSPGDCEVDFGGSCTALLADPGNDVVSAVTSIDGGTTWTSMGNPPNIVNLGNVTGKTATEKHLCYDDLEEQLEACGMSTIGINTKVYVFYDGTSLGQAAVEAAYTAVMDWLTQHPDFTPVLRDPSQQRNYNHLNAAGVYTPFTYGTTPGENVFHCAMAGERWLDWAIAPITGDFNNSVDPSAEPAYDTNTGGAVGNTYGSTTGGTIHAAGIGHKAADVAGYSYTGAGGVITGKVNHWVGYGNIFAGTTAGSATDSYGSGIPWSDVPHNFGAVAGGSCTRATSMSKPDGTNFNNASNNLRMSWTFPFFLPQGRAVQAINWSYNQWAAQTALSLPGGGSVIPVQFYCNASYDTATSSGPKGHSVLSWEGNWSTGASNTWTAPNTWTKLAEEADFATQNNLTDTLERSKNNAVHLGPPPMANKSTDDVLCIMFADESDAAYHGRSGGSTPTFVDTFYSSHGKATKGENPYWASGAAATPSFPNFVTHGINDDRVVQPTYTYRLDLLEYNARRAAYITGGHSYKSFLYPSRPSNGPGHAHKALPLQAVAGIANGTMGTSGLWNVGTAPTTAGTNSDNSPYPDSVTGVTDKCDYANLTALETDNPYWDTTLFPIPAGNPDTTTWGGLESKGFGTNSQCQSFSASTFEEDLEVFLGQGGTACDDTDCISFEILENGSPKAGAEFFINGTAYTTDSNGEITNGANAALVGLTGTVTFGFEGAETFTYLLPGICSEFKFVFNYGESSYDVCVVYPDVSCACGGETSEIVIMTGPYTATDASVPSDGINGTVTNETTGTVTNLTNAMNSMISGSDHRTTVPFTGEIPDGRYTIYIENLAPFSDTPYKECRLILCNATYRLQMLFKDSMSNIKCDKCGKANEDFITAYTLWRALKITGWDPEYAAYIDTNITELQAALTSAEAGNCKCC